MLSLSDLAKIEKNKIEGGAAWLLLLEILIPPDTVLHLVRNTEDVVWSGFTWTAFPFELDAPRESSSGDLPNFRVRVSNVTRAVEYWLEEGGGGVGATVSLIVVLANALGDNAPVLEENFSVQSTSYDKDWVTFVLNGATNLFRRTPTRRFLKNFCPFQYKGPECKCTSALSDCDKSLTACRERNNEARFGGEPGIPQGGLYALR